MHKLNASCNECHTRRMKCEYPGKTNVGVGSGMGAGLLTKGWPIIVVPPPKCESLEVRRQEVMVRERVNELAEVCLEVDCDMVCAMHECGHLVGCRGRCTWGLCGCGLVR